MKQFTPRNRLNPRSRENIRLIKSMRPTEPKVYLPWLTWLNPLRSDLYHWLLVISWRKFLLIISLFYFGLNAIFAWLYLITESSIANAEPGSYRDAYFFSIHTLSTVGYGSMYPQNLAAHLLVTVEIFIGLLCIAILTGLMFARFAKPTSRVLFSEVAVICPFDGLPTLMFRAANRRDNRILEAQVRVSLLRDEITQEGHKLRRFYDLPLLRSQSPVFALSWLVMHPIDENSPFYNLTLEKLKDCRCELWISLTGLDETFSQTIHTRYAYSMDHLLWNHQFVDIFSQADNGQWYINLEKFHDTEPFKLN